MTEAHIDDLEVNAAVQPLSDEDLAPVAAKVEQAQRDFAAGTLSGWNLILIMVAVAVIVVIIVRFCNRASAALVACEDAESKEDRKQNLNAPLGKRYSE